MNVFIVAWLAMLATGLAVAWLHRPPRHGQAQADRDFWGLVGEVAGSARLANPDRELAVQAELHETIRTLAATIDGLTARLHAPDQRVGACLVDVVRAKQPADEMGCSRGLLDALDRAGEVVRTLLDFPAPIQPLTDEQTEKLMGWAFDQAPAERYSTGSTLGGLGLVKNLDSP